MAGVFSFFSRSSTAEPEMVIGMPEDVSHNVHVGFNEINGTLVSVGR